MDNNQEKITSYVASPYFMGFAIFLAIVCAYFAMDTLSGYWMFAALLSGGAYLWGRFAAHGIQVDIQAESCRVYPGQSIEMVCTLRNEKCLPLLWLRWEQAFPLYACLSVPEGFVRCDAIDPETEQVVGAAIAKRFSFIKWYATVTWTATFEAVSRGVYAPERVMIYTGDGFGFTTHHQAFSLPLPPTFVVYPRLVGVDTQSFFKNTWSATTGARGTIEDVSVLRGTRPYQAHDSAKRINWRLAARGGELSVNIYDHIAPRSVYFFLDTATFSGISPDTAAFEDTLSILASVLGDLWTQEMHVSLYLPHGEVAQMEESHTLDDSLLALALADCSDPKATFSQQSMAQLMGAQSGNAYYICYDATCCGYDQVFGETGLSCYAVLSHQDPQNSPEPMSLDLRVQVLDDLKRR